MNTLTWETDGAHVANVDQLAMTETCRSVIHLSSRGQRQLATNGGVRQKQPLKRKRKYHGDTTHVCVTSNSMTL